MNVKIIDRIRLLFHKDRESYFRFYSILGFYPRHLHYYEQALVHRSHSVRNGKGIPLNNERLEFLGDAVLNSVVADIVYHTFQNNREGFLTSIRSRIVQRCTLNKVALELGLNTMLDSALPPKQTSNSNLTGNAFEALMGAIYLDRGYAVCMSFVQHQIIGKYIDLNKLQNKEQNFKSKLLEWCQKNKFAATFTTLSEEMNAQTHDTVFETLVLINGIAGESGKGRTKKESQQQAAEYTLKKIHGNGAWLDSFLAAIKQQEQAGQQQEQADSNSFAGQGPTDTATASADASDIEDMEDEEAYDRFPMRHSEHTATVDAAEDAAFLAGQDNQ